MGKDLEDRLQTFSQKGEGDREIYEQALLDLPFGEALYEALKSAFLKTVAANHIQSRLDSKGLQPHEGAIYFNRKLIKGLQGKEFLEKYIELRIDLTFPKERLGAEFEHILNGWHPRVKQRPRPPRGAEIMDLDKIDLMYRAYDLVEGHLAQGENEHQSVLLATLQFYTRVRPPRLGKLPASDKRYQQIKRHNLVIFTSIFPASVGNSVGNEFSGEKNKGLVFRLTP